MPSVVPSRTVRTDLLLELTHALRAELLEKGEFLPSTWVEEAANDLASGRIQGWVLRDPEPTGLAFASPRAARAYGHVHVLPGSSAPSRAFALLSALREHRPTPHLRLDVGLTGLSAAQEEAVRAAADPALGETALLRYAMEWPIGKDPTEVPFTPPLRTVAVRDVRPEALADLDWRSFQGTPDETLVADTPDDDRRVIEEILGGLLGRFLDEASVALLDEEGALLGFLLTSEQTPRRAIFLDLVVRSDQRRKGLGGSLLRWGRRALAALGYESVRLWVTESNRPARVLYDRLGFRVTGQALIYRFGVAPGSVPQPQRSR